MARIRTVKPEFWTDETVAEVSVTARLLLIGSLNFADDEGGLERSAKQLKAQVFPYDNIDCEPLVLELLRVGLFIEYEVANRKYLHIKGFRKHQKVENKAKPRVPVYDPSLNTNLTLPQYSPSPPLEVAENKLSLKEGKGREGSGKDLVPTEPVAQKRDDGPVERIFEHWRSEYRHPKAVLDPKRRRVIQRALERYDEPTLCASISGYRLSPHHMGQNAQGAVYDDICLFLRDAEHIDRGLNCARAPPTAAKSAVEMAREKLRQAVNGDGRVVSEQSGSASSSGVGSTARMLR